jgi:GNAT superfamily N-acetyltransferase
MTTTTTATRRRDGLEISTDRARLDIDWIHVSLRETYWATNIPRDVVTRSLDGSLVFGVYDGARQVGLARVITDRATFAYLADVFIEPSLRGRGLADWLMTTIRAHPELQGLRRWMLATADAHALYAKHGFTPLAHPARFMEISVRNAYGAG